MSSVPAPGDKAVPSTSALAIPAAGLAAALFAALLMGLLAWDDRQQTFLNARSLAVNMADLLEQHTETLFEQSAFLLQEAVQVGHEHAIKPDLPTQQARLQALVDAGPHIKSILVTNASGQVVLRSRDLPISALDLSAARYMDRLTQGDGMVLVGSDALRQEEAGNVIGLLRPVRDDGGFIGLAAVLMSADYYKHFFEQVDVGFPATVSLVRGDGRVLVRKPKVAEAPPTIRPIREVVGDVTTAVVTAPSPYDGRERIYALERLKGMDVWVSVGLETAAVEARWHRRLAGLATFFASAMVGIAALTAIAMNWAARERRTRARLRQANQSLESRVAERTGALMETNARLSGALADKETLFREVHHRVKNNLQVVASLLRLQSMKLPPELRGSFEDMLNRIHSMGLVHELLYRSNQAASIDLGAYLRSLLSSVADSTLDDPSRVRLTVEAAPMSIDMETAIPLGLLVNELLTNALKHAFPNGRRGSIRLTLDRDAGDGILIRVEDDGVGFAPGKAGADGMLDSGTGGIGLMLVRSLSEQVDAQVTPMPRPGGGAVWQVRLAGRQLQAA